MQILLARRTLKEAEKNYKVQIWSADNKYRVDDKAWHPRREKDEINLVTNIYRIGQQQCPIENYANDWDFNFQEKKL